MPKFANACHLAASLPAMEVVTQQPGVANAGTEASRASAAKLQKDLEFVQRMLAAARTVEDFVAAASAAASVADAAAKEAEATHPQAGPAAHLGEGGAPIALTVAGLPAHPDWNWARAKRYFCHELKLRVAHVEKQTHSGLAVLRFFDQKTCDDAKKVLETTSLGSSPLTVTDGETAEAAALREEARGSKRAAEDGRGGKAKVARTGVMEAPSHINAVVCAWWDRPYKDQLQDKLDKVESALADVTKAMHKRTRNKAQLPWVQAAMSSGAAGGGSGALFKPAAPLLGIFRSPQIESYRNKNEFTCGHDVEGNPTTGFLLGGMVDGISAVGDVSETRHTSREGRSYARAMTDFLRNGTTLPPWDKRTNPCDGFWRTLLVRDGRKTTFMPGPGGAGATATAPPFADLDPYKYLVTVPAADSAEAERATPHMPQPPAGPPTPLDQVQEQEPTCPPADEVLLMVQVNPRYSQVASDFKLMHSQLVAFAKHMRAHAAKEGLGLTHMLVQFHWGVANAAPSDAPIRRCPETDQDLLTPPEPASGAAAAADPQDSTSLGTFHDSLCDLKFRISPAAFFQVNAPATCVLYKLASEWAAPHSNVVLFDVCCGTGTIGIAMAHRVHKVIGVETVVSAIEDARANAALNGITNAEFVCGKAEDVLGDLLQTHTADGREVVAVVDPPRNGLHKHVIRGLLSCTPLKRIVYISCNPTSLAENLKMLCAPAEGPAKKGGKAAAAELHTPFVPIKAAAVDLFPHTAHVESVVLLERQ